MIADVIEAIDDEDEGNLIIEVNPSLDTIYKASIDNTSFHFEFTVTPEGREIEITADESSYQYITANIGSNSIEFLIDWDYLKSADIAVPRTDIIMV